MKSDELINYLDDSIILEKDFHGYLRNFDKALGAFDKAGLLLNVENANFSIKKYNFWNK